MQIYNLIAQRDNMSNLQVAEASRQVAELSRSDSIAMKIVAEKSMKVAELTRKDSSDMRVIAGVTLMFLPGTFTAVCIFFPGAVMEHSGCN